MAYNPIDPALGGPLPPPDPQDPLPRDMERPTERGEDMTRAGVEQELTEEPSRPLTDDEKEAARGDPGRQPRTYAPQSERVPKPPAPGDREVIQEGMESDAAGSPSAAAHPGDRSDPSELR